MPGRSSEVELTPLGSTKPDWDGQKRNSKASFDALDLPIKRSSTSGALDLAKFQVSIPSPAKKASRNLDALDLAKPHQIGTPSPAKKPDRTLSALDLARPVRAGLPHHQTVKSSMESMRGAFGGLNAPTLALMAGVRSPKIAHKIADHLHQNQSMHTSMMNTFSNHMKQHGTAGLDKTMANATNNILQQKISAAVKLQQNQSKWKLTKR